MEKVLQQKWAVGATLFYTPPEVNGSNPLTFHTRILLCVSNVLYRKEWYTCTGGGEETQDVDIEVAAQREWLVSLLGILPYAFCRAGTTCFESPAVGNLDDERERSTSVPTCLCGHPPATIICSEGAL